MSLIKLQEKIGIPADGAFGPATLKAAAAYYKLNSNRAAHFFAQCAHESGNWKATSENLNYGAKGLRGIFGKYFPTDALAKAYERQPAKIANRVYANRMGNGPESSGMGFKFRGRGFLQLTGYNNVKAFAKDMRLPDVLTDPSLLEEDYAMDTAIWFFKSNNLWKICDEGVNDDVIKRLTRKINGGYTGLEHRIKETNKVYEWVK